jgi:DNA-binding beta-propeller fold protein YncE
VRRASAAVLLALACAGCGSVTVQELPPAAGPPRSPAPARPPDGETLRVGGTPERVVVDARTHVAAVATRGPDQRVLVDLRARRVLRRVALPEAPRRLAEDDGGATAADGGRLRVVLSARERVLQLYDATSRRRVARAAAGVGPTHVACLTRGGWCWVLDTRGDALLVFRVGDDDLELTRRVYLPGGPYGIAVDRPRGRLWVTLPGRNELVGLPAHGRPHVVARHATVRQPDSVAVDAATGQVVVTGRTDGLLQLVTP